MKVFPWRDIVRSTPLVSWTAIVSPILAVLIGASSPAHALAGRTMPSACSNFYEHVNGAWLKRAQIPHDRSSWGAFQEVEQQNQAEILANLDRGLKQPLPPDGTTRRKLLDLFASGMNADAIEKAGLAPFDDLFARIDALSDRDQLMDLLAHLHRLGVPAGFALEIGIDPEDSSRYIPMLGQSGIGLPDRDFYLGPDPGVRALRATYLQHVAKMLHLAGTPANRARRNAERIIALETRLARASMSLVALRDASAIHNRMKLAELRRRAGGLDWRRYLVAVGVGANTDIDVAQPLFLREVARAAVDLPIGEWKPYLRWHVLLAYGPYLPARLEEAHLRFYETTLQGVQQRRPRDVRVLEGIGGRYGELAMGQAIGALYAEGRLHPKAHARVEAMVGTIRRTLRERIETLAWMSDETRDEALRKLDAMRVKIGSRADPVDDRGLEIDSETWIENIMRMAEFELQRRLDRLGRPVDRDEWNMGAHEANAYYDMQMNEIVVPAGVLLPPFFDPSGDEASNYGALGSIIGHEMTHAFDDEGRRYDHDGNLRDWWAEEDEQRYYQLTEPIVRQYAAYVGAGGMRIDGRLTLGENIADIGGLKLAYRALQATRGNADGRVLDAEADRRFFTAYAASWREKSRGETERMLIATDPHAPTRFRVNGPLRHMPEFSRAFGCAEVRERTSPAGIW